MGKKNYEVNDPTPVIFKATKNATAVNMDVFDEVSVLDAAQSGPMTQIGSSNRWQGSFTPDAEGDWSIEITDNLGGEAIKHYSVGNYNVNSIGANVQSVETKVDNLDVKVDNLQSPPQIG